MPKYEFAIAVNDEPEAHRKNEGDIISIRSYPRNCGRKVIDEYLVVIVECNASDPRVLKQRLRAPLWENGLVEWVDWREFQTRKSRPLKPGEDDVDLELYPPEEYVWDIKAGKPMERPRREAKRRYKIPLSVLGNIDLAKVQNKTYIYQPFKKASQLVEKFDGKDGRYDLKVQDVDCVATGMSAEQEVVFQWSAVDNLVVDKYTNSYVEP